MQTETRLLDQDLARSRRAHSSRISCSTDAAPGRTPRGAGPAACMASMRFAGMVARRQAALRRKAAAQACGAVRPTLASGGSASISLVRGRFMMRSMTFASMGMFGTPEAAQRIPHHLIGNHAVALLAGDVHHRHGEDHLRERRHHDGPAQFLAHAREFGDHRAFHVRQTRFTEMAAHGADDHRAAAGGAGKRHRRTWACPPAGLPLQPGA